ncbi:hypothetical protein EOD39_3786 [Acipenser ruthenus]|uniref:Uncharacterized protein n=1 Tax=Acipenser ruthenus TaxID=7906 RepID=A0A444ULE3_ACIRT|nr:hypothetical protein EOD39_3786 [Acipenser ruthenus]
MAASLCWLNRIAFHFRIGDKLIRDLVSKYKFHLFAEKQTCNARQVHDCRGLETFNYNIGFEHEPEFLYDVYQPYAVNTVYNVYFEFNDCSGVFQNASDEDVDEGYVITGDSIGLRLTAVQFWKCSEVGLKLPSHKKQQDCKFVVAKSLPQQGTKLGTLIR